MLKSILYINKFCATSQSCGYWLKIKIKKKKEKSLGRAKFLFIREKSMSLGEGEKKDITKVFTLDI